MANLLRVLVLIFAVLVLLLSSVFVEGADGVRSYSVGGVVTDVVAILVIAGVAWSWRNRRASTR